MAERHHGWLRTILVAGAAGGTRPFHQIQNRGPLNDRSSGSRTRNRFCRRWRRHVGASEEGNMTDFLIGLAIGGGAAFGVAAVFVLLALTGWIDSGSH